MNEWLLADLEGQNGGRARQQARDFLNKLQQRCDRIVFQGGTPWAKKAYGLMKGDKPEARYASKLLHSILGDSTSVLCSKRVTRQF